MTGRTIPTWQPPALKLARFIAAHHPAAVHDDCWPAFITLTADLADAAPPTETDAGKLLQAAKNARHLTNAGPRADGTVPHYTRHALQDAARYMLQWDTEPATATA